MTVRFIFKRKATEFVMTRKQKKVLLRICLAAILLVILAFLPLKGIAKFICYLVPYLIIGYDVLIKAVKGLFRGHPFDENFLMAVATVGATALGEYTEGAAVMLLYQIGELFQSYAVGKSRRSIGALMDIRPDYANTEGPDGQLIKVSPSNLEPNTVIVVQSGEKVPLDGIVISGSTSVDTHALTGESVPRNLREGDEIVSGFINLSGVVKVRTTCRFEESTASKILDMVENASSKKSKSEDFITRFARVYTPAVCIAALLLAIVPPVIITLTPGLSPNWGKWIYRALTFLVISCPCALVISVPLSFFAGIGGGSKAGVLIKGSNYLEALSDIKTIVFDKTGTMTCGVFEVSGVHHNTLENSKIIEYAALAESYSSHPISKSLQKAYGKPIDKSRVANISEIGGRGITAEVDGIPIALGNTKLMEELQISYLDCHCVGTVVHVAINGEYAGHILISDIIKPDAEEAVRQLRSCGVTKTVMLTGDRKAVAEKVAAQLGIDIVYSELLPGDKVIKVEELLENTRNKLAFVGDGINDAPVLARADIGIAMGALGSDAAIEAADVVLMDDSPMKIVKAIRISKKCIRIVKENIVGAIGIKLICLALGALGIAGMWLAIFADVGVLIIAVLNAIRALSVKNL